MIKTVLAPQPREARRGLSIGKCAMWLVLGLLAAVQMFPLVWLLNFSLASSNEIFTTGLLIIPKVIRWDNYAKAFVDGKFMAYFTNSMIVNVLAVLLVLALSVMLAFAITRMKWKLSATVRNIILLGMMIPIHATLLPNFVIYDQLRIRDTLFALLIPYVAFSLPQGLFLTSGFMSGIPREIEESSMIDGCGIYRMLISIITPMLRNSLVTVSIMTFLNNWNEFMMASTYLSSPRWKTLPFSVLEFTGQYSSNYAAQFAVMALSAAPVVILYILLNRHITKGVALGAVKG
jgi:raffinose/stachyose/melibiose transport system permease protein